MSLRLKCAYVIVKCAIAITGARADAAAIHAEVRNKQVIFKNCAYLNDCTSGTNNTQADNAKDLYVVIPMYNLINMVKIIQRQQVYGNIPY